MSWWNVIHCTKCGSASSIFWPLWFRCCEVFLRFLSYEVFTYITSSGASSPFSWQPFPPLCWYACFHRAPMGAHRRSWMVAETTMPGQLCLLQPHSYLIQISLPVLSPLSLLYIHLFLDKSLFQIPVFEKCHMGWSLWDKEATTIYFAVCWNWIRDVHWPITGRLWNKCCDWSLMMCICYIHGDLWAEGLAASVRLLTVHTLVKLKCEPCNWGTGYLTSGNWNPCILEPSRASAICV